MGGAQQYRTDLDKYDHNQLQDLWRGGGMTEDEKLQYTEMVGKKEKEFGKEADALVRLFGYTSCSLSKQSALGFAWDNAESGHKKVLFHIKWKR